MLVFEVPADVAGPLDLMVRGELLLGDVLDGDGPITAALAVLKTVGDKPLASSAKP